MKPHTVLNVNEEYLSWLNDNDVVKYLEIRHNSYDLNKLKSYVESFKDYDTKFLFGVFCHKAEEHIGNTSVYDIYY